MENVYVLAAFYPRFNIRDRIAFSSSFSISFLFHCEEGLLPARGYLAVKLLIFLCTWELSSNQCIWLKNYVKNTQKDETKGKGLCLFPGKQHVKAPTWCRWGQFVVSHFNSRPLISIRSISFHFNYVVCRTTPSAIYHHSATNKRKEQRLEKHENIFENAFYEFHFIPTGTWIQIEEEEEEGRERTNV